MGSRVRKRESASLFLWDYIILGLGQTRSFFKITNPLPKLSEASDVSTSWFDWRASTVNHLPLCHFDFYCACAYSLASPQQTSTGGGEGGMLILGQAILWSPGLCEAVASRWSKQAYAPWLIMLKNVQFPLHPSLLIITIYSNRIILSKIFIIYF